MNRRVLVTGASRGIGRAIALALANEGFEVTGCFREQFAAAERLLGALHDRSDSGRILQLDISDRSACAAALELDVDEHGAYWAVVCNAGVHRDAVFPGMRGEDWDYVMRTNLDGFYNVLRPLVMPMLRKREGGRIVALSSVAGVMGNRGQVNYSASKAGIIGAAKALALELAKKKITVNVVAPGLIQTDMLEGLPVDELRQLIPMGRLGTAEEVAAVVSFLLSDGASYMPGQTLSVNGGMR